MVLRCLLWEDDRITSSRSEPYILTQDGVRSPLVVFSCSGLSISD